MAKTTRATVLRISNNRKLEQRLSTFKNTGRMCVCVHLFVCLFEKMAADHSCEKNANSCQVKLAEFELDPNFQCVWNQH